jgi:signal transduction histidine kinase
VLHDFLLANKIVILKMIEKRTLAIDELDKRSVRQPREGLVIFLNQLISAFESLPDAEEVHSSLDRPVEIINKNEVIHSAGVFGQEFLNQGYQLNHVVQSYGLMCQSIMELATEKKVQILSSEFRKLNMCLDIAIASAVTEFYIENHHNMKAQEIEGLGSLAHELRNALNSINLSLQLIKSGQVGFAGSTGQILELNLKRMNDLISRALTKVKLQAEPAIQTQSVSLLKIVNQVIETALIEASERNQTIEAKVDEGLLINVDEQLFYSALSNLIQNALKYSRAGGCIQVRGYQGNSRLVVEVEDECGGLKDEGVDLFKAFEQKNENRKGLGLGLTIAQKAIWRHRGEVEVQNLKGKGCIFRIILPN